MEHKVKSCMITENTEWYTCPLFNTDEGECKHPAFPKDRSIDIALCPLRKEPLTLVASFK